MLLPGLGHLVARVRMRAAVVVATLVDIAAMLGLFAVVGPVHSKSDLADVIADRRVFVGIAVGLVVLAVTRLGTAADIGWRTRPREGRAAIGLAGAAAFIVTFAGVVPMVVAAGYVWQTDHAVEQVFASHDATTAMPGTVGSEVPGDTTPDGSAPSSAPDSTPGTDPATGDSVAPVTAPGTAPATTLAAPLVGQERVNVLLLGGDAGPGRWSLRTDSMVVVSIDPATGDTAMISVPRNLQHLPFPAGTALAAAFPHGFTDIANAVYPYVNQRRQLAGGGDDAGAQAIKLGVAQLLGIPINYYVLVDMAGFVGVVDALGGIDVYVPTRVPAPGNPPKSKHPVPAWFEVGQHHFDGTLALAYSRTREADSDYFRMTRQRCVLAGIAAAATPGALATGLGDLVDAFGAAVRTDIPRDRLGDMAHLVERYSSAGGLAAVRTLQLTPPLIQPAQWSPSRVRQLVVGVLYPQKATGGNGSGSPPLATSCRV